MNKILKILLLEDNPYDAEIVKRLLIKEGLQFEFHQAMDKEEYLQALDQFKPDVILSDNTLPQFNATEALEIFAQRGLTIPFILVTGTVSEEFAVNVIKSGADDYVLKDRLSRLPAAIIAALQKRKVEKEITAYKFALDQSSIISITDEKGIITYVNENFCAISKFTYHELVGSNHNIVRSDYHPKSFFKDLWSTIGRGNIWRGDFCNQAKDGSLYWVYATIIPFLNAAGKPYQYIAIRFDITEAKNTEQELNIAHDHLLFHLENSPLGYIEWDNLLHVKSWSKRSEEIFGWTAEEFNRHHINGYSQVYEEDLPLVIKIGEQLLNGEIENISFQHRNYTKDGRIIWCEWFDSVLKDDDGNTSAILSLVQDITERKRIDEDLRRSEMRLKEAQVLSQIGNWEIDFVNNIQLWSDEMYRIYGIEKTEVIPTSELFISLMHPDDIGFAQKEVDKALTDLSNSNFEFRFIRNGGVTRHGYCEWKFEFDTNKKPVRLYGIVQDITARKKAEEDIIISNEELRRLSEHLQNIREEERIHIAREIHDELGQQLSGLKMDVHSLKRNLGNQEKTIASKMNDIIHLTDEIVKSVRRISSNLRPSVLDDLGLIAALEWLSNDVQNKSGIKVDFLTDHENIDIPLTIATGIFRIYQEAVNNAVKHSNAHYITTSLKLSDDILTLEIIDDGKGIAKEDFNKNTFGLLGIKERIYIMNGKYEIDSEPGKGTKIFISIPMPLIN